MGYTVGTGVATAQKIVQRPTAFLPGLHPLGWQVGPDHSAKVTCLGEDDITGSGSADGNSFLDESCFAAC